VLASRSALARGEVAAARWTTATRGLLVVLLGATLALGPANVVVVLVYFGGRRGRELYGLPRNPQRVPSLPR